MEPFPGDDLLTVDRVAAYLNVRLTTIYRWCRKGQLPCIKLGKEWRIRRAALDDFLRQRERASTLVGQLRGFVTVPDQLLAIVETIDDMHRLDAAFFQLGEAHGGTLVKFHDRESIALPALRDALERQGLGVRRLEIEGRLRFVAGDVPLADRPAALRALLAERATTDRTIWAVLNWADRIDLAAALAQQEVLMDLIGAVPLVVLTEVLERVADDWPADARRRLRDLERGVITLTADSLTLSRRMRPLG